MLKRLTLIVAVAGLSACTGLGSGPKTMGGNPDLTVVGSGDLPAPQRVDMFSKARPYSIGPFDRLNVDVFGIQELSQREIQTDAGGRISVPLAGVIEVAGKTPSEVEDIIEQRLRLKYVRDPQVTVNLKEAVSQVFTVEGQVTLPGTYPVGGHMSLLRAIATARGPAEFAKLDDIVVFRSVGGQQMAALYNLGAIRRGAYPDPDIYANDVIVVGDSPARKLFKDLLQVLPTLTYPLVVALQGK